MVCVGCGSAGKSGASTVTLHSTQSTFKRIFQSKQGFAPGDAFIASSALSGGGHQEAYCVISPRKRTSWCAVTVVRPHGQVTAQGVFVNLPKLSGTIPLLSGTGAYEGAVGSLTTSGLIDRTASVTIRLR
jgi:hypothetical protein